jgi:UDP:flavonoid glycosyltransferase YjiC (YdhE family)
MQAACEDADAVVCSLIGAAGYTIARQRGVPCILTQLQPIWPTRAFPASIGWSRQTGRPYPNLLSHLVAEQGLWQMMRPTRGSRRGQVTALPRTPLASPFAHARRRRLPVLLGFSPAVQPPPPDWPDHIHVTGYWFLDPPRWSAPDELAGFLSAGPPPVYVGFASWHNDTQTSHVIRAALRQAGLRGVVLGDTRRDTSTEEVLVVDEVPHAWLFPQMAAVVHHGGAGTTAVGLRAGVPTVVCSFIGDQSYWGSRVHALGAGPPPIPIRHLTADRLAQALGHATRDPSFRARAAALGGQIRAEDGVARAVKLITAHLSG